MEHFGDFPRKDGTFSGIFSKMRKYDALDR